jgi:hypothetical protein
MNWLFSARKVEVGPKTAGERERKNERRQKKKPEIPFRDYAKCRSSGAARRKNN